MGSCPDAQTRRAGDVSFARRSAGRQRYQGEQLAARSPEEIYERTWAVALLDKVLGRLREETAASGQSTRFEHFKAALMGEGPHSRYTELALTLGHNRARL